MEHVAGQNVSFCGSRKLALHGILYRPDGDGSRPGIVFMHGMRSDSREFGDFTALLAARGYLVLSFDFSGHGSSAGVPGMVTRQSHQEDSRAACQFLRAAGASKLVVVGHSFGVHAALMMLPEQESVSAGVLVAPQIRSGAGLAGWRQAAFRAVGLLCKVCNPLLAGAYLPAKKNYESNFVDRRASERAAEIDWDPGRVHACTLGYAVDMNNADLACRVAKPVMVVWGAHDKKVPERSMRQLFNALPAAQRSLCLLPNSGHSPFTDRDSQTLLNEIDIFCKRHI